MSTPRHPLLVDLRRMAPVWAIVVVTATSTLLGIRFLGSRFLLRAEYQTLDGCRIGEVLRERARQSVDRLRHALGEKQVARQGQSASGLLRGDPAGSAAAADLQQAARFCPTMAGVHALLAELALWQGDDASAFLEQGLEQLVLRDEQGARTNFEQALRLSPGNATAMGELGALYVRTGKLELADKLREAATPAALATAPGLVFQAYLAAAAGDSTRATALALQSLGENPDQPLLFPVIGHWFSQSGQAAEGARQLEAAAAKAHAESPGSHHAVALLYQEAGQWQDAIRALDRAIRLVPNNAALYLQKSQLLDKLGRTNEARDAYHDALERDPELVRGAEKAG